jgi:hypothetical protein
LNFSIQVLCEWCLSGWKGKVKLSEQDVECGYMKTVKILSYMKPKMKIYSPVNQGKKDKKNEKALDLITLRKNT